jgi:hypothetical protein
MEPSMANSEDLRDRFFFEYDMGNKNYNFEHSKPLQFKKSNMMFPGKKEDKSKKKEKKRHFIEEENSSGKRRCKKKHEEGTNNVHSKKLKIV